MNLLKQKLTSRISSYRQIRALCYDHKLSCGFPVKWGGKWDICIYGKLVPTGLRSLDWDGYMWIDFIKNYQKNPVHHTEQELVEYVLKNNQYK